MVAQKQRDARIAVVIPCLDEEATIGRVVDDFRAQLPDARIIVFDNASSDDTAGVAREHGAEVVREPRVGKGYVVERILDEVDADYLVMVDGDDTYPAEKVHELLACVMDGEADMAVGARLAEHGERAFRPLHVLGNNLVRRVVNLVGGARLSDILSGYRVFNREVARRIPLVSSGFEVEVELTMQMLYFRRRIVEVSVPYRERPAGSVSKLRTVRDGVLVLWKIFSLFRAFKPLTFFGMIGLGFAAAGIAAGILPIHDYFTDPNHYVHHVPLAILATGLMLLAAGSVVLGILLHAINWRLKELHSVLVRR